MDYAFSPGGGYNFLGRRLLERRPNTVVIRQRSIRDVESFIEHLVATAIDGKINEERVGDLLIFSHGDATAWMKIDLDTSSVGPDGKPAKETTYEVVKQAVASQSVLIHPALHEADPAIPFDVHIRGCQIGQSEALVKKLKEAFGSPRSVTAPKYIHRAGGVGVRSKRLRKKIKYGSYEYLAYLFRLTRKDTPKGTPKDPRTAPFETREQVIDAFHNHGFKFIDESAENRRSPIPKSSWDGWLRRDLDPKKEGRSQRKRFVKLGQDIREGHSKLRLWHVFWHEIDRVPITVPGVTSNPGNRPAKESRLREYISARRDFQTPDPQTDGVPAYERFENTSAIDFLDSFTWRCTWRKKKNELFCVGTRHVYTLEVPIVDATTQYLLFNLFPALDSEGQIPARWRLRSVQNLPHPHTNSDLFLTVW